MTTQTKSFLICFLIAVIILLLFKDCTKSEIPINPSQVDSVAIYKKALSISVSQAIEKQTKVDEQKKIVALKDSIYLSEKSKWNAVKNKYKKPPVTPCDTIINEIISHGDSALAACDSLNLENKKLQDSNEALTTELWFVKTTSQTVIEKQDEKIAEQDVQIDSLTRSNKKLKRKVVLYKVLSALGWGLNAVPR